MNYILTEAGEIKEEPDLLKWAQWLETADRHVGKTKIGDAEVSTVFLFIDHNFSGEGSPILFETMVFGGPLGMEQERYETRAQAEAGHRMWVERVKIAAAKEQ